MGLFDSLFGKPDDSISDPDQLRDTLFAATRAGDARRLERLARANETATLEHFRTWQRVPDAVRADHAAVQRYVQCMVGVAQVFAEKLGRPELMAALTGTPQSNPLVRWQNTLQQARELMDALRHREARQLLTDALIEGEGMSGSGVDISLAVTHGLIAECDFHTGTAAQAVPHLEQALALCERSNDAAGIIAYTGSLFEAHRYLGHSEQAAGLAEQMATLDTPNATRWRTRARIVRAGEPLNRVVAVVNGVTSEVDEVQLVGVVRAQFVFERNRITLRPAATHTERGEKLGSAGRHEEALAAFREASAADPFDPHSRYLEAFTLLHLRRYAAAADVYRRVEELAPGWFHCRSDLWLAEQLLLGRLDAADFTALVLLEDGRLAPAEAVPMAERLLKRRPKLPHALLLLGRHLAHSGRAAEGRTAIRRGLAADPEPDVRTRLLTELAVLTEDKAEREGLFREAAALNGNLVAAASAACALRAR